MYYENEQIACYQNPLLSPDAWTEVNGGRPVNEGVKAALICQFSCPVRNRCPFVADSARDVITGNGWYDYYGRHFPFHPDEIEVFQAATFIGIAPTSLRIIMRAKNIPVVRQVRRVSYIRLEDMFELAESHGPRHGTEIRYNLHLLRGEVPCIFCARKHEKEVENHEGVLRLGVR